MVEDKRVFEVFKDNNWVEVSISDLKKGEEFRIFDAGIRYKDHLGDDTWICNGPNLLTNDGIRYVRTKSMKKYEVELSIKVKAVVCAENKDDIINHVYDLEKVCKIVDEFTVNIDSAKEIESNDEE